MKRLARPLILRVLIAHLLLSLVLTIPSARGEIKATERLLEGVKYLASDELEGRGVGTKGLDLAAEYVRQEFERAGLDVTRVNGGAFQTFEMTVGSELAESNTLQFAGPEGKTFELQLDSDFRPASFGGSADFSAPIVFCGYGIEAPDKQYDDFAGINLKGKVALILRRVPQQGNPHGPFAGPHGGMSRHAELRTKVSNAFGRGAVAVLLVNDPYSSRNAGVKRQEQIGKATDQALQVAEELLAIDTADVEAFVAARKKLADAIRHRKVVVEQDAGADADPLMEFGYGGHDENRSIPVLQITQTACNQLLQAALGTSLPQIEGAIDEDLKPRSAELAGWRADGRVNIRRVRTDVHNVIGVLEGEGPLADETLVIGAHYDHVGRGGPGSLLPGSTEVHNGADDNASGAIALIEIARRLAAREQKLPRRVVFIAFTAEEIGLVGSAKYVKEPVFPLESTIAMLNLDMVGRMQNSKLTVFGTGTSPWWEEVVPQHTKELSLDLSSKPEGFGPSDHSSFYGKKIPVLHFFTGTHGDYHRPTDDWQKLNLEGMTLVANLVEGIAVKTVQRAQRPEYVEVKQQEQAARGGNRPYFGSIPDFGSEGSGYAISGAAPGSPADEAGLKGGDRIVEFGGQKIDSLDDFDLALRKFSAGDQVEVVVERDDQREKLTVTLGQPR